MPTMHLIPSSSKRDWCGLDGRRVVPLGTSYSSGRSRHNVPIEPSKPEVTTAPTHLLSLTREQIAPTISRPTFPSGPRARCKHHSDRTRCVPNMLCRHHCFAIHTSPLVHDYLGGATSGIVPRRPHAIMPMTSFLGMARFSPTSQLGFPAYARPSVLICGVCSDSVQSKLSFCHKRNLLRDSLQPLYHRYVSGLVL